MAHSAAGGVGFGAGKCVWVVWYTLLIWDVQVLRLAAGLCVLFSEDSLIYTRGFDYLLAMW